MSSHFPWLGTKPQGGAKKNLRQSGRQMPQTEGVNCHNWGVWNLIKPESQHIYLYVVWRPWGKSVSTAGVNRVCSTLVVSSVRIDSFKPKVSLALSQKQPKRPKAAKSLLPNPVWAAALEMAKNTRMREEEPSKAAQGGPERPGRLWAFPVAATESPSSESVIGSGIVFRVSGVTQCSWSCGRPTLRSFQSFH